MSAKRKEGGAPELSPGAAVQVVGAQARPELEGRPGVLSAFHTQTGSWLVHLDGEARKRLFKPEELMSLRHGGVSTTAALPHDGPSVGSPRQSDGKAEPEASRRRPPRWSALSAGGATPPRNADADAGPPAIVRRMEEMERRLGDQDALIGKLLVSQSRGVVDSCGESLETRIEQIEFMLGDLLGERLISRLEALEEAGARSASSVASLGKELRRLGAEAAASTSSSSSSAFLDGGRLEGLEASGVRLLEDVRGVEEELKRLAAATARRLAELEDERAGELAGRLETCRALQADVGRLDEDLRGLAAVTARRLTELGEQTASAISSSTKGDRGMEVLTGRLGDTEATCGMLRVDLARLEQEIEKQSHTMCSHISECDSRLAAASRGRPLEEQLCSRVACLEESGARLTAELRAVEQELTLEKGAIAECRASASDCALQLGHLRADCEGVDHRLSERQRDLGASIAAMERRLASRSVVAPAPPRRRPGVRSEVCLAMDAVAASAGAAEQAALRATCSTLCRSASAAQVQLRCPGEETRSEAPARRVGDGAGGLRGTAASSTEADGGGTPQISSGLSSCDAGHAAALHVAELPLASRSASSPRPAVAAAASEPRATPRQEAHAPAMWSTESAPESAPEQPSSAEAAVPTVSCGSETRFFFIGEDDDIEVVDDGDDEEVVEESAADGDDSAMNFDIASAADEGSTAAGSAALDSIVVGSAASSYRLGVGGGEAAGSRPQPRLADLASDEEVIDEADAAFYAAPRAPSHAGEDAAEGPPEGPEAPGAERRGAGDDPLQSALLAAMPAWAGRDFRVVLFKLRLIGICTPEDLLEALEAPGDRHLIRRLGEAAGRHFSFEALAACKAELRRRLR